MKSLLARSSNRNESYSKCTSTTTLQSQLETTGPLDWLNSVPTSEIACTVHPNSHGESWIDGPVWKYSFHCCSLRCCCVQNSSGRSFLIPGTFIMLPRLQERMKEPTLRSDCCGVQNWRLHMFTNLLCACWHCALNGCRLRHGGALRLVWKDVSTCERRATVLNVGWLEEKEKV